MSQARDAKHTVKDGDKPFICPYGSCTSKFGKPGRTDFGSHFTCHGRKLPPHLMIDLAAKPPLLGKLRLDEPGFKDYGFDKPEYEGWINTQGVVAPAPKAKAKPRCTSKSQELNYSSLVYWFEELAVRVNGQVQRFASWDVLVSYFLAGKELKVLHLGKDWLPTLTIELNRREHTPERFHVKYQVKPHFECFDIENYALEQLEHFERCNHFIFGLTGWNLTDKLTAAQLGYEYWWATEGSMCDIHILQGEERKMAASSYYGARVSAVEGELRSTEAKEIENGTYSYEELLDEGAVEDVWMQLDIISMYPFLMKNWYPVGLARRSEQGAEEFANGVTGIYEVEYIRPPGLKLAILPKRENKRLDWITEPGTDSGHYTNIDLRLALNYGYRLKFKGSCLCWDTKGRPFDKFVSKLFALRQSEPDAAVRSLIKHLLVTLYGKMAQKETGTIANLKLITEEEMFDLLDAGRGHDIVDENGTYYIREQDSIATGKQPTKPNHLGCFILSWSREFMAELFQVVDYKYLATRTDSMLVAYPEYIKLRDAGYLGENELGKLKVEHGVIYATQQNHATSYTLHYLDKQGECQTLVKGERQVKTCAQ